MDKQQAARRRAEINRDLTLLWADAGKVQELMMEVTKRAQAGNWTMEQYQKERGSLQEQKASIGERIKVLTEELKAVDESLGT